METRNYEEIIAADPNADIDALGLTADEYARAEAFRQQMRALDEKIRGALEIDVPELRVPALPALDDQDRVVPMRHARKARFTTPAWIGIAASIALVAFMGSLYVDLGTSYPSLAAEVVAHLDHEPGALALTSEPVAERILATVVNDNGVSLKGNLGLVTYARSCVINGKTIPHLVLQGRNGPVTLLLMPDEMVDGATPIAGESINGVILPVGDGSIAIIGEREEDLAEIEKQVVDSVTWNI